MLPTTTHNTSSLLEISCNAAGVPSNACGNVIVLWSNSSDIFFISWCSVQKSLQAHRMRVISNCWHKRLSSEAVIMALASLSNRAVKEQVANTQSCNHTGQHCSLSPDWAISSALILDLPIAWGDNNLSTLHLRHSWNGNPISPPI